MDNKYASIVIYDMYMDAAGPWFVIGQSAFQSVDQAMKYVDKMKQGNPQCPECSSTMWIESGETPDDQYEFVVHDGTRTNGKALFSNHTPYMDLDDLNAVCARCGANVIGIMNI